MLLITVRAETRSTKPLCSRFFVMLLSISVGLVCFVFAMKWLSNNAAQGEDFVDASFIGVLKYSC